MTKHNRIQWLDVARSIAIVSITFNHAVNRSFHIYTDQYSEFISIPIGISLAKTLLYAFSRIGVPLFLMITGALLLSRDYAGEKTIRFLKHNWLRLFVTTELWLAIMFWYKQFLPGSILYKEGIVVCIIRFLMTLLFLNPFTMGSMWYMEMILCVYLMIPILATALKSIDHRYFYIPLFIVIFSSFVLPDLNGVLSTLGFSKSLEPALSTANVFSMYIAYILLGYFVVNDEVLKSLKKMHLVIGCVSSFFLFCGVQFWIFTMKNDYVVGESYQSFLLILIAVFVFELLRRIDFSDKFLNTTYALSRISFGIYFVHICIMEAVVVLLDYSNLNIEHLPRFFLLELISFFGAIVIIHVFERNSWISRWLFGIK